MPVFLSSSEMDRKDESVYYFVDQINVYPSIHENNIEVVYDSGYY